MAEDKFPSYYDDPKYDYQKYWRRRQYEDKAEAVALKKLFSLVPKKDIIADIGAGFGRLTPTYAPLAQKCILIDPASKQLEKAKKLKKRYPHLYFQQASAEKLPLKKESVDLLLFIRTLHHLKNPKPIFAEFNRVIKPKGFLIIEFANKVHLKSFIKALLRLDFQYIFNPQPISISQKKGVAPFLNYHPYQVKKMLQKSGFKIIKTLSVSNFRYSLFKKILPLKIILFLEKIAQEVNAPFYYGPSVFILAQKK